MPQIARVGVDIVGGAPIIGPGAPTVTVNDLTISVVGDLVFSHGESPHVLPAIVSGAPTIFAQDRPISLTGLSVASCMHPVSTGSFNTFGL